MTPGSILWLVVLALLGVMFAVIARRMSVLIARTRDLERIQRAVESIDLRLAAATEPLVSRLDAIRRRSGDPTSLAAELDPILAMLQALAAETRQLRMPAAMAAQADALAHETDRAVRAAELVGHGLAGLVATRGPRELEAQTSLKRGALNLRHAREAFGRTAAEVAALRPVDLAPRADGRWRPPSSASGPAFPDPSDQDLDEPIEPRM